MFTHVNKLIIIIALSLCMIVALSNCHFELHLSNDFYNDFDF